MSRICMQNIVAIFVLSLCMVVFNDANAAIQEPPFVDIYRSSQVTAEKIKEQFHDELQQLDQVCLAPGGITTGDNIKQYDTLTQKITNGINKMGRFAYAHVSDVRYQDKKYTFITIDLVDEKDKFRLDYFTSPPQQTIQDPDNLIRDWNQYQKIGFDLFLKDGKPATFKSCPAFHCLFGFEHPKLKPYLLLFEKHVSRDKNQLIEILKRDKDPKKRAAAVFLLAHIKDGRELINIIAPAMRDPDENVRNNVMRVLGLTLMKLKHPAFPIKKAVAALDYPSATDHNKALLMIDTLVKQKKYANYVKKHASLQLIAFLKMSQPNVHEFAYSILKTISNQQYGEHDYAAWEAWLKYDE